MENVTCAPAAWSRASTTTATCWPMSACPITRPRRAAAPPALAHPRGAGRHRHRRHRTPAQLCGQRQARRDAGLRGARLRGELRRLPGDRTVVVTNNDDAYRTAIALKRRGSTCPASSMRGPRRRPAAEEARALGIPVETGRASRQGQGRAASSRRRALPQAGEGAVLEEIACDAVAMSGGWSPVVHLWSHCGGKLTWDEAARCSAPIPTARRPTRWRGLRRLRGAPSGRHSCWRGLADATRRARRWQGIGQRPNGKPRQRPMRSGEAPIAPVWIMPQGAGPKLRAPRCGSISRTT
jgi:hypothetical protein